MSRQVDENRIDLGPGRYRLTRLRDNAGDSGPLLEAINRNPLTSDADPDDPVRIPNAVIIGYGVRVGSFYARSYQQQDWWLTTAVAEFLEVRIDKQSAFIRFRTENGSVYELVSE